jgi:3D (Asp-Asp-Asp) domain-containing protein
MAGSRQRASGQISDGMRIDDHKFWAGSASNGSVFPMGAKTKMESSANGAGEVTKYEDTTERIKAAQEMAKAKVKSHQGRLPEYRN